METVGTRELKQNPNAVIRRVLDTGQEIEVTAYGTPTGVRLVPDRGRRSARWVPGSDLVGVPPMSPANAEDLVSQIEHAREDDLVRDPWEDRP
ncbi:type II toxin-antitoxin system Phd/YefM family antitoxin [Cellulosimicrobium protaetiae]|uniref:Type II toxin-antitoxin system prevent-host-death family antitoxin n=1 Tax=Cellulosimicrobium protaetiae TaxID=2587808 RepID=A0A6M5U9R3_9MICO|nr:type II toxin-antitoxin system prevent-host-death family antitoxin [Cellulosimicrobium protaetiae]QJW34864.1 type II toxin-antitoxin system prevent-host-death family antitoxin [Cellulosimicrobium protaetiae]